MTNWYLKELNDEEEELRLQRRAEDRGGPMYDIDEIWELIPDVFDELWSRSEYPEKCYEIQNYEYQIRGLIYFVEQLTQKIEFNQVSAAIQDFDKGLTNHNSSAIGNISFQTWSPGFSIPDEEEGCDLIDMLNSDLITWMKQKTNACLKRPIDDDIIYSLQIILMLFIEDVRGVEY